MFRAGLLLIIRRIDNVWTATGIVNITHDYTNCLWTVVSTDDEQQTCLKHVEAYYWNKLRENNASCRFMLYGYITLHGQQNIKFGSICSCDFLFLFRRVFVFLYLCFLCNLPLVSWVVTQINKFGVAGKATEGPRRVEAPKRKEYHNFSVLSGWIPLLFYFGRYLEPLDWK